MTAASYPSPANKGQRLAQLLSREEVHVLLGACSAGTTTGIRN